MVVLAVLVLVLVLVLALVMMVVMAVVVVVVVLAAAAATVRRNVKRTHRLDIPSSPSPIVQLETPTSHTDSNSFRERAHSGGDGCACDGW